MLGPKSLKGEVAKEREDREAVARARAAETVARIVKQMVADGYPVEAVNKAEHTRDFIPVGFYRGWADHFDETLALCLVNAWWGKAALVNLSRLLIANSRNSYFWNADKAL